MLISYKRNTDEGADNSVLEGYIDSINAQLKQRLAFSDQLTNMQDFNIFGLGENATYINTTGKPDNISRLKFYFRSGKDVAGVYPLQGIEAFPDEGGTFQLGERIGSQADVVLNFTDFRAIDSIHTVYVTPNTGNETDFQRYRKRIIALFIEGQGTDGNPKKLLLKSPKDTDIPADAVTNQEELKAAVDEFNRPHKTYKMVSGFTSTPYLLTSPNDDGQRASIINIGAEIFHGDSSDYLCSFNMINALPLSQFGFDKTKTQQLDFQLDFEKVTTEGGCTYEMDFQATNSNSTLDISQKGSSFTISVPSVKVGVFQGTSVEIGSPMSYTRSSSETKQASESNQKQVTEKLTMQLPNTFYRVKNFTSANIAAVVADIKIYYTDTDFSLTVPLNKKILLCTDETAVTNSVISAI